MTPISVQRTRKKGDGINDSPKHEIAREKSCCVEFAKLRAALDTAERERDQARRDLTQRESALEKIEDAIKKLGEMAARAQEERARARKREGAIVGRMLRTPRAAPGLAHGAHEGWHAAQSALHEGRALHGVGERCATPDGASDCEGGAKSTGGARVTPEARAEWLRQRFLFPEGRESFVAIVAEQIREAVEEEREACARVADKWLAAYPEDIFIEPPQGQHGQTVDACSGRAARHVARGIAADLRAAEPE